MGQLRKTGELAEKEPQQNEELQDQEYPMVGKIPVGALVARDAQTESVGIRLRGDNVTPSGMVADLTKSLGKERILQGATAPTSFCRYLRGENASRRSQI